MSRGCDGAGACGVLRRNQNEIRARGRWDACGMDNRNPGANGVAPSPTREAIDVPLACSQSPPTALRFRPFSFGVPVSSPTFPCGLVLGQIKNGTGRGGGVCAHRRDPPEDVPVGRAHADPEWSVDPEFHRLAYLAG